MIRNSFLFLERISHKAEHNIWNQGIHDWSSFIGAEKVKGFSQRRKSYFDRRLKQARKELFDYNSSFFNTLPSSETWRLYDHFSDDCLFLDIETTGYYGDISVLGAYDGDQVMTLVKGQSLNKDNMRHIFRGKKLLVTFNGQSFDTPVINRYYPNIVPKIPHLDLRFPLARLGYTGGLKIIERILGIKRCEEAEGVTGEDAIAFWHEYVSTGNQKALELLVKYNEEDIVNLKPLAVFVYKELSQHLKNKFSL